MEKYLNLKIIKGAISIYTSSSRSASSWCWVDWKLWARWSSIKSWLDSVRWIRAWWSSVVTWLVGKWLVWAWWSSVKARLHGILWVWRRYVYTWSWDLRHIAWGYLAAGIIWILFVCAEIWQVDISWTSREKCKSCTFVQYITMTSK